MTAQSLEEEMLEYFVQLTEAEQKSILHLIRTFVESKEHFSPVTIEEYNRELEEANAR